MNPKEIGRKDWEIIQSSKNTMNQELIEQIKKEWHEDTCNVLGGSQTSFKEKIARFKKEEELKKDLEEDYAYWKNEGQKWNHDLYFRLAQGRKRLLDKYFSESPEDTMGR